MENCSGGNCGCWDGNLGRKSGAVGDPPRRGAAQASSGWHIRTCCDRLRFRQEECTYPFEDDKNVILP